MKTISQLFLVTFSLIILLSTPTISLATDTPPNPPSEGHGGSGDVNPGGGAPIGGGTLILMGLAIAYAGKKFYDGRKEELEE